MKVQHRIGGGCNFVHLRTDHATRVRVLEPAEVVKLSRRIGGEVTAASGQHSEGLLILMGFPCPVRPRWDSRKCHGPSLFGLHWFCLVAFRAQKAGRLQGYGVWCSGSWWGFPRQVDKGPRRICTPFLGESLIANYLAHSESPVLRLEAAWNPVSHVLLGSYRHELREPKSRWDVGEIHVPHQLRDINAWQPTVPAFGQATSVGPWPSPLRWVVGLMMYRCDVEGFLVNCPL